MRKSIISFSLSMVLTFLSVGIACGCNSCANAAEISENKSIALTRDNYSTYLNISPKFYPDISRNYYYSSIIKANTYHGVVFYCSVSSASSTLTFEDAVVKVKIYGCYDVSFDTVTCEETLTISLNYGGTGKEVLTQSVSKGLYNPKGLGYYVEEVNGKVFLNQ